MQSSNAPAKFPLPFANAGTKNTIPTASQIAVTPGAASLTDGFPPLTRTPIAAGGIPPFGADMNGILFGISSNTQWENAGGFYPYDAAFSTAIGGYPRGAVLARADLSGFWLCQTENNTTNPDTGGAGWVAAFSSGLVGQTRNLSMSVSAASASATLTADEIVVETALGGQTYRLASFNKTVNLATTGAGGMDTGTAPVSGFVALYAIYNPTTQASALLATNATAAVQPNVYGGANLPAGYTASALVSVVATNSSSQFVPFIQTDRYIAQTQVQVLSTATTQATPTSLLIAAAIPKNAKSFDGIMSVSSTAPSNMSIGVSPTSNNLIGNRALQSSSTGAFTLVGSFTGVPVGIPQTLFYTAASSAGTPSFSLYITGYTF